MLRNTHLEGWAVINYAYDELWEYKYNQWLTTQRKPNGLFDTPEDQAEEYASRWAMIPLTRAMDTLVINVSTESGRIKAALKKIQAQLSDFVEWISL